MANNTKIHNVVVCCDGTWCGAETGTRSNIQILADAFASKNQDRYVRAVDGQPVPPFNLNTSTRVRYFNGVGLNGRLDLQKENKLFALLNRLPVVSQVVGGIADKLFYIWNVVLADDLPARTKEAYRFIAEFYQGPDESRIWLFGLSRGAHTARTVAGMINNVGILDFKNKLTDEGARQAAVDEAYNIYRSKETKHRPGAEGTAAEAFRQENSWKRGRLPPVIFMGLLDTVGAEGVPSIRFNAAPPDILDYDYGFYDTNVSSEVQHVFQAASTHDRLGLFQPCPVLRNPDVAAAETAPDGYAGQHYKGVEFSTREVWYPGAHYDLGRQDFVFGNDPLISRIFRAVNPGRINVNCTPELADYPLLGHALPAHKPPGSSSSSNVSSDVCLVAEINRHNQGMLPAADASGDATWKALVDGKYGDASSDWSVSGLFWRGVDFGIKRMRPLLWGLGRVAAVLPVPQSWKWFQLPYTIDAEDIILGPLVSGLALALGTSPEWLLEHRHIPVPPGDEDNPVDKVPEFFKVPFDNGSDCSYWSSSSGKSCRGRGWFMSTAYDTCQQELKELQD